MSESTDLAYALASNYDRHPLLQPGKVYRADGTKRFISALP